MRSLFMGLPAVFLMASAAMASDPAIGVWQTEPDRKDLISYIEIKDCGGSLCGTITAAFDRAGNKVSTPNVGKLLFWDMNVDGQGSYSGGTVWVPLLNFRAAARMEFQGSNLAVTGCKGPLCNGQVWRRVR